MVFRCLHCESNVGSEVVRDLGRLRLPVVIPYQFALRRGGGASCQGSVADRSYPLVPFRWQLGWGGRHILTSCLCFRPPAQLAVFFRKNRLHGKLVPPLLQPPSPEGGGCSTYQSRNPFSHKYPVGWALQAYFAAA